jgi:phosphoribosylformylglycinamidine (FGAM) synthase-like amidotransferase family enzyme
MSTSPKALILAGEGINCEQETADAFSLAGFQSVVRHINDLISENVTEQVLMSQFSVLALPGGFSFGDDLGSGKVLALKIQHRLKWDLEKYAQNGGMVIGICNGFQALIKMGTFGKDLSITHNAGGKFLDTWVKVSPGSNRCVWLKGIGTIDLPVRHGEGRVIMQEKNRAEILSKFERQGMVCLKYEQNPNGSDQSIAGLCDPTGRVFGLMPHPEAFVRWTAHPEWTAQASRSGSPGQGLAIFENAFQEAKSAR